MEERKLCPGGYNPGQCLNASCPSQLHRPLVSGIEQEAEFRRQCIEEARKESDKRERIEFLKEERRKMGMEAFLTSSDDQVDKDVGPQTSENRRCPQFDLQSLKTPDVAKTMREPARPSCMLQPPDFTPPSDDYNDLSRFLRISTMPGYNTNDQVSEYHDNHNMAVWNNRKDIDPQVFKMKRDWLSVWGEFNVKEQCWRKAWAEKFGSN